MTVSQQLKEKQYIYTWKVPSSSSGDIHEVRLHKNGNWVCDCIGFKTHGHCKHIDYIKNPFENDYEIGDADEFSLERKLLKMKNSDDKKAKIIALYWEAKNREYETEKSYQSAYKRDLRAAKNLEGYPLDKIEETMTFLQGEDIPKWTLETVFKYIDDLNELKKNDEPIRI